MSKFLKLFAGLLFLSGLAGAFSGCQKDLMTDPEATDSDIIKGQYIVVYQDGVQVKTEGDVTYEEGISQMRSATLDLLREYRVPEKNLGYVYSFALEGFSAELSDEAFVALRKDPRVKYVEPVVEMKAFLTTQTDATWGIDRVDQRALPLSTTYSYENTGLGVHAYIIDTGINYSHNEFGARASFGFDAFGGSGLDGNGHGTHVAGTVGGTTYGLAKQVSLVAVRVLDNDGSGTNAGVIAGMDWVAANRVRPAVANMSLGGGASTAVDDAVARMYNAGVPVIVAAGNGNWLGIAANACYYSPARAPRAYTIGATTSADAKTSWSNYGDCVNLFAPGSGITSAWNTSSTAINTISGTSMATPHVTGAAALFLEINPDATSQQVYDALTETSTKGIVTSSRTTNNHLLYTLAFNGTAPVNNPPVASFTFQVSDLAVAFDAGGSTDSDGTIQSYAWEFGDEGTGTGATPTHTYSAAGTYSVKLTVTDDDGATGTLTKSVTVTSSVPNQPPVANFTFNANDLSVSFDGSGSSDSDGSIAGYAWDFGDGATGSGVTASHTYSAAGTYSVILTVTDDDGATGTTTREVTVSITPVGDNPPVIDSFNVTKSNAGPWRKASVSWAVSDPDSDLSLVRLEIWNNTTLLQRIDVGVSGANASGSTELKSRTTPTEVRITVTDNNNNSATQSKPY